MNLRTKIVLTYIGLIVVGVIAVSIVSSWQIDDYLERRTASQLRSQESLLTKLFSSGSLKIDSLGTYDDQLQDVARTLGIRLTIVAKDGGVMYDSEVQRDSLIHLENHAHRPEVLRARDGETGMDTRHSVSVDEDFLYAARRITGSAAGVLDSAYVRAALPLTEIRALNTQIQKIIWAVAIITLFVSVVVSYQVSKRIARPVLEIARTAQSIKSGDLERRAPVRSRDEIGTLATAINEMAETLNKDIARMRTLEHVRREFLGNVSHELRTPIFAVQGFLETLMDGAVDDPIVNREFLKKAHTHAVRLNALLSDLIEISRIESGDMKMSFRYFPVVEFVRQVAEEMRPQAEKKGTKLSVEQEVPGETDVYGDRDRLKQVMVNLVDNALKYTEAGGSVTCRVVGDAQSCTISVQDTGCGIAKEHQGRIFERFYRVDRDRSREVGGTGLGLAIVKHIVEAHGGTVALSSAVGKGSTFSFTLKR
jgi:two-component system phosphate regulon sensor histidine kinase PhoR